MCHIGIKYNDVELVEFLPTNISMCFERNHRDVLGHDEEPRLALSKQSRAAFTTLV